MPDTTQNQVNAIVAQKIAQWSCINYDGVWLTYSALSDETGIPIKELKKVCHELEKNGTIKSEPIYDENGRYKGRGYFST